MKNIWLVYDRKDNYVGMHRYDTKKQAKSKARIYSECRDKHPDGKPRFIVGRLVLEEGK